MYTIINDSTYLIFRGLYALGNIIVCLTSTLLDFTIINIAQGVG